MRRASLLSLLVLNTALTGCAGLPERGALPALRAPDTLASAASLSPEGGDFPATNWWTGFGDTTLTALIEEGLAHSPDVAAAAARVRAAEALVQQAGAARLPHVSLDATGGGQKLSQNQGFPPQFVPDNILSQGRIAGNAGFDLDLWGKNRASLTAVTSSARAAQVDAAQARLMLSTAIAMAYADLAASFAQRDVAADTLRIARETQNLFARRVRAGLDSDLSLRRAETRTRQAEAALLAMDQAIALGRNALAALVGAGPDRGLNIARPSLTAQANASVPAHLPMDLVSRRPDLVAARLRSEAAAARIAVARADFYPSINLSAVAGLQSIGISSLLKGSSSFATFGPALHLPLFDGGAIKGRYAQSRASYDEAVAHYDATLIGALRDVADALVQKRALAPQIAATQQALDAGLATHRLVRLRHDQGLASQIELLAAEDALSAARQQLARLNSQNLLADLALIRALGGGYIDTPLSPADRTE